ncbi:glucoamylase family protein [Pararhizobium gei]|uniref:glucoamylase family protein n=1 Tax=Pararhizobium gei TaxID=1395951 RepID=UPI0023DB40E3|nr:glucoamylase family protein [Rhizobium gei]
MLLKNDSDTALIDRLQKAAFEYFLDHANPDNGLIADTSQPGSPCSIAATGFGLSAYAAGVERHWISRTDAAGRALSTLRFFAQSPQSRDRDATGYKGLYYHFLDMRTGARAWRSELSLIDSAILIAGMLTAAAYFEENDPVEAEIRSLAAMLYARANWAWAADGQGALWLAWKPRSGFLPYHWTCYSEAHILYVLALASPSFPIGKESYDAFTRHFDWMTVDDRPFLYAGPLFTHLFSQAWIDFRGIRDAPMRQKQTDYFENTCRAISVQRAYAIRNPGRFAGYGPNLWGLTACDGPLRPRRLYDGRRQDFSGYAARGAPLGPDDGTVAPWAPLASVAHAPEAAISATRNIIAAYPGVLENGQFVGSFNPSIPSKTSEGWLNSRIIGLDQGLLVMMIENHRSGLFWRRMREHPVMARGLKVAGFSDGWL